MENGFAMLLRCHLAILSKLLLCCGFVSADVGEVVTLDVDNVAAIGTATGRSGVRIVTEDGQIVRFNADADAKHVVVDDVADAPSLLMQADRLVCRVNFVSVIGLRGSVPSISTFRLDPNPEMKAKFAPGLSIPLPFARDKTVHAVIATPIMIYIAVESSDGQNEIWRIEAGTAGYGKPVAIHEGERPVRALGMNYQGHLVAAIQQDSESSLRFHHALTGDVLLTVPTEIKEVSAIAFGPDELLYVAGKLGDTSGVYRVDVAYRERRQVGVARLIQKEPGIRSVSSDGEYLVTLSDKRVKRFALAKSDQ